MEIIVSARHMELTNELREYAETKFAVFAEEYHKLTTVRLVLEMERGWHLAEANVTGKHIDMEAKARTRDMYASIDEVFEKLHKQLRRHLEKVHSHRQSQQLAETIKDEMPALIAEETEE